MGFWELLFKHKKHDKDRMAPKDNLPGDELWSRAIEAVDSGHSSEASRLFALAMRTNPWKYCGVGPGSWKPAQAHQQIASGTVQTCNHHVLNGLLENCHIVDQFVFDPFPDPIQKRGRDVGIAPLLEDLTDEMRAIRLRAIKGLGKSGDKQAIEPLVETLLSTSDDAGVREEAGAALTELGWVPADPEHEIAIALAERSRFEATIAQGAAVVGSLINALESKYPWIRWEAATALGKIGDRWALDSLVLMLRDPHKTAREMAALALKRLGDPRAIDALLAARQDSNQYVVKEVSEALHALGYKP